MNVGFTYKIQDKTNPDLVYYGSSELPTMDDRMKIHINKYTAWKNNNDNPGCYSYKVLEMENWEATLLKIVFFTIKWELHEQERLLIEYQTCVNHNVPNRTKAEYRKAVPENAREYYQKNKDKTIERSKQYYQDNKEKQLKYGKEYRKKNNEKIKSHTNKKFDCPCGGKYTHKHKAKHLKTAKHQKWLCKSIA